MGFEKQQRRIKHKQENNRLWVRSQSFHNGSKPNTKYKFNVEHNNEGDGATCKRCPAPEVLASSSHL